MTPISCVLVGEESLLIGCGEYLVAQGHDIRAVVSRDGDIRRWAEKHGMPVTDEFAALPELAPAGSFGWLLSIANLRVIPEAVLELPARGAVNFHDGPLPHYAGLNTPAWAIRGGEKAHGVTWHLIAGGIDEGDILEQRTLEIGPEETAFSLNSKCYAAGMDSFPALLGQLVSNRLDRQTQDLSQRRYFARDDRPGMAGLLDFSRPAEALAAATRALDFGEYFNPLLCPKVMLGGRLMIVGRAEVDATASTSAAGTVLDVTPGTLRVATGAGVLLMESLTGMDGRPVELTTITAGGEMLAAPDPDTAARLDAATQRAARAEPRWTRLLRQMRPAALSMVQATDDAPVWKTRKLAARGLAAPEAAACVLAWARMSAGARDAAIAYADGATLRACAEVPGLLSEWVPLMADDGATVAGATAEITRQTALVAEAGPYAADLPLLDPAMSHLRLPDIAFAADRQAPLPGSALTVALGEGGGLTLHYDSARISPEAIELLDDRLSATLAAHEGAGKTPFAQLAPLPETERRRLVESWNDTARESAGPATVHQAFEAQAARSPEATALVFEDRVLSYAELNARANALARRLQEHGVEPGRTVGLCVERGPLLLIGALAILKAGGAYVPLDPGYPAERLAHYVSDSAASVIVTQDALRQSLPESETEIVTADGDVPETADDMANVDGGAGSGDPAYVIYTSGSTGTPRGVVVEHGNVANFFVGMDEVVDHEAGGVWLAVTSLAFDISVLELFYTLARGFKLVLCSDDGRAAVSRGPIGGSGRRADFSLYYWSNDCEAGPRKYELLLEGAKFADANGFDALWSPERHFHAFGGPYPNPAVTGAAVAALTSNIEVRAGSIVAPLHHPARIAEEWSIIDNLTNGRAGLGIASGWHPNDFVLRPENAPPDNKKAMFETIDQLRRLWRGEAVEFPKKSGEMVPVVTQPRPVSGELPIWVTIAGNPETWRQAGEIGANVLTHLLGQTIEEVGEKITLYHQALRENGHDPADFTVTVMLHTLIGKDRDAVREIAKGPLQSYLGSAAGLVKQYAWTFPAFKKPKGVETPFDLDLSELDGEVVEAILDFAFDRYFYDAGLFGTVEDGIARVEQLKQIGVGEIACLIDYGIPNEDVLEGLKYLAKVREGSNRPACLDDRDFSIAAQIIRHGVTHMQATPSLARMLSMNDEARLALGRLKHLYLGGEALPGALVEDLRRCTRARITNMYGPTETTIWSATQTVDGPEGGRAAVAIGRPIANTRLYVLDGDGAPLPVGVAGELHIGGAGVARGYWQREALTAQRFVPDHITGSGRLCRTGDLVRWRPDGRLDFLGRTDHQIKIRGHRIEPGDIEASLAGHPRVRDCVVTAREGASGEAELAAYLLAEGTPDSAELRRHVAAQLPEVMVPRHFVTLDRFPLTPNGKIDRKALPAAQATAERAADIPAAVTGSAAEIALIWQRILGVAQVRAGDSFFDLGGHSLLAVQAHRDIRDELEVPELSITDIFRFPKLDALAAHVDSLRHPQAESGAAATAAGLQGAARAETMSRRRAMRAARQGRAK